MVRVVDTLSQTLWASNIVLQRHILRFAELQGGAQYEGGGYAHHTIMLARPNVNKPRNDPLLIRDGLVWFVMVN